jgi:hypothetical protein
VLSVSKKPEERTSVPTNFPATNPPLPSGDYSYVLEIVMNMQTSIGRLTEAVDTMKVQSSNHDKKLEDIGRDVHAAKTTVKVVGAILAALLAFAGWAIRQGVSAFVQLRHSAPAQSQIIK